MMFRVPRVDVLAYLEGKIKANLKLAERVKANVARSPVMSMFASIPGGPKAEEISGNLNQKILEENEALEFMRKYLLADPMGFVTLNSEEAKFLKYLKPCECDACVAEKPGQAGPEGQKGNTGPESSDLDAEDGPFAFKPFDASDLASASIHTERLPADVLPADMLPAG